MKAIVPEAEVYVWLGRTDMRAGFERLAALVHERLQRSVMGGGLYVFVSRCRKRVKLLYWDKDGYALWYKRLEAGAFRIADGDATEMISGVDLEALLSGVDLTRIRLKKDVEKGLYTAS
jgi:transposase